MLKALKKWLRKRNDEKLGLRVVPDDPTLRGLWQPKNDTQYAMAWRVLSQLWPDVDIDLVKRINPGANPTSIGSVFRIRSRR